ncbi:MAG TPA: hypothetical protein VIX17_23895 [Pyrinomonadaceae bacterium]|jgi:hypothetical protein
MNNPKNRPSRKEDLILMLWEECPGESAGERELIYIQQRLSDSLDVLDSPARIARTLADNHVPLRHPEVLAADSKWREDQINKAPDLLELDFETVDNAISSMKRLETLRVRFLSEGDEAHWQIVVEHAREWKIQLARLPNEVAREMVQWLAVWLQNPDIFEDWSDLRQNSPEFRERFNSRI